MKVLILGSGGREHALAWAVTRSPRVTEVVCAPGNGGMAQIARCVPVDLKDLDAMVGLAEAEQPGPDHRRPRAAALAGHRRRAPRARPARLRPHARRRHARIQQGLRQALPAAAQHPHAQLRRLRLRGRGRKGHRGLPSAHRGQGRRPGCGQGRHHVRLAPHRRRGRPGPVLGRASRRARAARSSSRSSSKATRSAFSA